VNESGKGMSPLHGAPGPTLELLLDDPAEHDFASAQRALDGLSEEMALRRPAGLPYCVAQVVAHLLANARYNLGVIGHPEPETFRPPLPDWPEVGPGEWERVRREYLSVLEELKQVARDASTLDQVVFAATQDEPGWTVGYKLTCSVAKHGAYHMGQIVVIRRLLGAWQD
jgi:uncharacterized damage-inducible protein DinB